VEFALVLPLLVVLLFVIVNGGLVYLDQLHLQSAARDAARIASVEPLQACSTALAELSANDVGTSSCEISGLLAGHGRGSTLVESEHFDPGDRKQDGESRCVVDVRVRTVTRATAGRSQWWWPPPSSH